MIQETQSLLKNIKSKDQQFKAEFEVFFFRPAFEISQEEPIVKSLSRAYKLVQGKKPKFKGLGGWIESVLLAEAGIPAVIFGSSGEGAHASVEYVDFDSVMATTEILIETIIDFCNS